MWASVRGRWKTIQAGTTREPERLTALFDSIRPQLQDSLRRIGLAYAYLLPESDLPLVLLAKAIAWEELPEDEETFEVWLDSSILRWVRDNKEIKATSLRDPMAPWGEFRRRVNSLRRSYRSYFLTFLPKTIGGQVTPGRSNRKPTWSWALLWDRLAADIPQSCLPEEWIKVRSGIAQPGKKGLPEGFIIPNILRPREIWQEALAKPLFQAALFIESRRPAWVRFPSNLSLMPKSASEHARFFRESLVKFGGIPTENAEEKDLIEKVLAWEDESLGPIELSSVELAQAALHFGFRPFDVESLLGSIHERDSNALEANRYFQRSLGEAAGAYDISTALSNLAARAYMEGDLRKALQWAQKSLRYDASNEMARWNLAAIHETIRKQYKDFGTHG